MLANLCFFLNIKKKNLIKKTLTPKFTFQKFNKNISPCFIHLAIEWNNYVFEHLAKELLLILISCCRQKKKNSFFTDVFVIIRRLFRFACPFVVCCCKQNNIYQNNSNNSSSLTHAI